MNKTLFGSSPFNAVKSQMSHILKYERNFSQNNEMPPPPPEEEDEDVDQCRGDDMKRCIYDLLSVEGIEINILFAPPGALIAIPTYY